MDRTFLAEPGKAIGALQTTSSFNKSFTQSPFVLQQLYGNVKPKGFEIVLSVKKYYVAQIRGCSYMTQFEIKKRSTASQKGQFREVIKKEN